MFDPENPPELQVSRWLNTGQDLSLAKLKGKVVMLAAFQMHCPGCKEHLLPQAGRIATAFNDDEVAVVGLHTVFEDHEAQSPEVLEGFLASARLPFPVGIDAPSGEDLPKTMAAYEIQGTPSILVFDRQGRLRRHYLGQVDDIRLAAELMALSMESPKAPREQSIAIEQRLAMALVDPDAHHHGGGCCGGGHHHHDHDHDHHHHHGGGCCGGGHHAHDHDHAHGEEHECRGDGSCGGKGSHDHKHGHGHEHAHGGGCGCGGKHG